MTFDAASLRRAILFTHRWLGIAGGFLFVLWFLSGIGMLWARMPFLGAAERLRSLPALDLDAARLPPAAAARFLGEGSFSDSSLGLHVAMVGPRPAYRFELASGPASVYADDGAPVALDADQAVRLARALYAQHAAPVRHVERLDAPDQWTLENRALLPAWRIALGDDDTWVYLSARTGEAFLTARREDRRWAYASAVPHWLYLTPLRRHGAVWGRIVIALSLLGTLLAASGLIGGVWQLVRARRRSPAMRLASPYAGLMRWHHYAGLAFGLVTFTWVASGCLSMDPGNWHPATEATASQREAVAGGRLDLDAITLDDLRDGLRAFAAPALSPVKELELVEFRGRPYLIATRSSLEPGGLADALEPRRGAFSAFDRDDVLAAARSAMPRARLIDGAWLERHDDYYYDLYGAAPLPVLRARFDDPARTWLYLDPASGAIVRKEERWSRVNRWLYHGLHSFDFAPLRSRPALRDAVIVLLSLGGLAVALTSIADGWRRLARQFRRPKAGRQRV